MKVFIIYDSKYGNTKTVAEAISEGIRETQAIEVTIGYVKKIDPKTLAGYDAIVIGAPNHMGKPSLAITEFIHALSRTNVWAKWFTAFDTYYKHERNFEKTMRKLEKQITQQLPGMSPITTGLSVKVEGIKGPIGEGELPKAKEFGRKIASQLLALERAK